MDAGSRRRIEQILERAETAGRWQLLEGEVYEVLREAGIPTPRFIVLPPDGDPAAWRQAASSLGDGGPVSGVVVKIQSPDILHKTEAGGIAFTTGDPESIAHAARQVLERVRANVPSAKIDGILVCEKVPYTANLPGGELLLSLRQDAAFGPVVVAGIGGLLTEWYGKLAPGRTTWIVSAHDPHLAQETPPDLAALGPAFAMLFRPSRLHENAPVDPARFWRTFRAMAELAVTFGIEGGATPFVLDEIEVNPMAAVPGRDPIALDGIGSFHRGVTRPRRRRIEKVKNLLAPRSAAVIGASGKAMNPGRIILQNLLGAEGVDRDRIYAIHPKETAIDGIPCFPSVGALPERVDLAIVSVPAEGARDAIRELVEQEKAHSIILIPGGFAETGERGLADQIIEIMEAGRSLPDGGPVLVGGNCLGIVSKRQYNTFFLPKYKLPFRDAPGDNLAAISQSGAYLVTLGSNLDGVIFPKSSISYGNQMDLTVSDFLDHYLDDQQVRVIACYLEGFQPLDGLRFVRAIAEHRRRGRSVIVFKAGKTPFGARAAASHTASLAGDYAVARELMVHAGALVTESLDQFADLIKTFSMLHDRAPAGLRVGVISNAGFECSCAMDALQALTPAPFSEVTKTRLGDCLPSIAHHDNPVDATPMATTEQFLAAIEAILDEPAVDAMVISPVPVTPALDVLPPDPSTHREDIRADRSLPTGMIRIFRASRKPIVAAVDSGPLYDPFVAMLETAGIPTFRKIDRAIAALSAYCSGRTP